MREIKFRAWDGEEMDYEPTVPYDWKLNDVFKDGDDLMQYTGLTDKNGKEIYEGDLLRVLDKDWPSGDYTNQTPKEYMKSISSICQVVYEPTEFFLKQVDGRGYFYPQLTEITHRDIFEIIGNIYENPELTK